MTGKNVLVLQNHIYYLLFPLATMKMSVTFYSLFHHFPLQTQQNNIHAIHNPDSRAPTVEQTQFSYVNFLIFKHSLYSNERLAFTICIHILKYSIQLYS